MELQKIFGSKEKAADFLNDSFSQEGEDIVLKRIFGEKKDGFFIDVGAHHPLRFSSTWKFYKKGWRGINIDAMPGSMELFKKWRPLDINLEIPVSDKEETIPFYIFNEPALNTFSEDLAKQRDGKLGYKIEKVIEIGTRTFAQVIHDHLPDGKTIDFLNIDAEGLDYRILTSNDWGKYRPSIVLVENELLFPDLLNSDVYRYLLSQGYELFSKLFRTAIFRSGTFYG